jgi:copper homeostasis protein
MGDSIRLEVCVDSVASAMAAERGGAYAVELCSDLAEGGTTPSAGQIAMVRKRIGIELRVLIRPRAGDFFYSSDEFNVMCRDILLAKQLGADGLAVGILDVDGNVDSARTAELVQLARPLRVTFHRAFDMTRNPDKSLESVVQTGCDRVLTSGAAKTAMEGIEPIGHLVKAAKDRICIVAAGGIREDNVREIVERTGVREIHAALQTPEPSPMRYRNEPTTMGTSPGVEYQHSLVHSEAVERLIQVAGEPVPATKA